jgi:hypothetical protein
MEQAELFAAGTAVSGSAEARAKIRERVRKLLAMTVENGATEAEALAAAKMVADLMAEHDLTYETVDDVMAERYGARRQDANCGLGRKTQHEVWIVAEEIGRLFHCKCWTRKRPDEGTTCAYFGTEADTEAAHNMRRSFALTMESEFAVYLRSPECRRSREKPQSRRPRFMSAMAARVNSRLESMRFIREQATHRAAMNTGRGLVLGSKKSQLSIHWDRYCAQTGLRLRTSSHKASRRSGSAYAAGLAAGSRVNLGGAAISGGVRMIGQRGAT